MVPDFYFFLIVVWTLYLASAVSPISPDRSLFNVSAPVTRQGNPLDTPAFAGTDYKAYLIPEPMTL
jgi:hypothetical protein